MEEFLQLLQERNSLTTSAKTSIGAESDLSRFSVDKSQEDIQNSSFAVQDIDNKIKLLLQNDPSLLDAVDDQGWGILNICIEEGAIELTQYLVNLMSAEQIERQRPEHPLLVAMNLDDTPAFDSIVEKNGLDLNYRTQANETLLYNAFYQINGLYFQKLLDKGANPFIKNRLGVDAFALCVEADKNDYLQSIYQKYDIEENYNELYLKKAIQKNNHEALETLLPYAQSDADTLFDLATGFGNIFAASQILDSEGFIPGLEQLSSITSLICQKYEKIQEQEAVTNVIDYLFAIKASFSQLVDGQGKSAWMLAIENDNPKVFFQLMRSDEDVNKADADGHTPLMYAVEHASLDMVATLLKKRANPNHCDRYNNTALMKAVRKGKKDIVDELLKYPVYVNAENKNHETALNIAVTNRRMDIVSSLIWAGADLLVNPAQFVKEENIYHFNFNNEYEKLLTNYDEQTIDNFIALNKLGFNLNEKNASGDTYLHHFIKNGFLGNFKAILRCSFDPNVRDTDGNTPVMCAMNKNSNAYITGLFTKFGELDLRTTNNKGEDIYDICVRTKRADRMQLLVDYDDNISPEQAKKAIIFLAQHGGLEQRWERLQKTLNEPYLTDALDNSLVMLSVAGNNKKDYDFLLKNHFYSNLKEKNANGQSLYQIIELLPTEQKIAYKQSIIYYGNKDNNADTKGNPPNP